MKRTLLLAGAAFSTLILASHAAAARDTPPPAVKSEIRHIMHKAHVPGLAIAKVENGRLVWHAAFGERAPGKPLTLDTVFNVASLTKPVFATTVLSLVADDTLELDEKVSKYWVDPDVADDPRHEMLTPRILLSHQSGFPNWRGNRPLAFMFTPGERQQYSGEGYEYLRRMLERKTGKSWPALLAKNVLEPAGMRHTSSGWTDAIGNNVAHGFNEAGEMIDTQLESRKPNAAANLMTTVDDYARFTAWVSKGAGLPAPLFEEMRRSQALQDDPGELFGLGWKLVPLKGDMALLHDGREPGVRTWALVLPGSHDALVIFTNSSNGELTFRPVAEAALEHGREIMANIDSLVWRYLVHLPPQALTPMSRGIARSPTFLSTLLHSVDTVLIQTSDLSPAEKALAAKRVDKYVFARFNGKVDAQRAQKLVERLLIKDGDALHLRTHFDADAARDWSEAMQI